MNSFTRAIACSLVAFSALSAQAFREAAIQQSAPGSSESRQSVSENSITWTNMSLKALVATAYGVRQDQVTGPKWLAEERFDIIASFPAGATEAQVPAMLQHLLAERFQLGAHEETKNLVFYALVSAKGGVKMTSADAPTIRPTVEMNSENVELKDYTMVKFAEFLTTNMRQPVVDETGLSGTFNIKLFVSMGDIRSARAVIAIRQLGLNLEKRSGPMKVVTVDKAEKTPTAN